MRTAVAILAALAIGATAQAIRARPNLAQHYRPPSPYLVPPCQCATDAGGPRISSVVVDADTVSLLLTAPIAAGTIRGGVEVSSRDLADPASAWVAEQFGIDAVDYTDPQGITTPSIQLQVSPAAKGTKRLLRVLVHGTGPTPITDASGTAFAGDVLGQPTDVGADYAWQGTVP